MVEKLITITGEAVGHPTSSRETVANEGSVILQRLVRLAIGSARRVTTGAGVDRHAMLSVRERTYIGQLMAQQTAQPQPALDAIVGAAREANRKGAPPVHLWNPPYCGDLDMRIAADGAWFYLKTPIGRPALVKLFASEEILKVAQHCLELHGGNGVMLDFGVEKIFRDAAIFLHMDATVDISKLKIVKSMFPATAGTYAGPE